MARVAREGLLKILEMLTPGLSTRETIAQSSCLVFVDGKIMTFNEEILASMDSPLPDFTGAVKAKPLLELLSKLKDDADVEIEQKDGELSVKGGKGSRKASLRMEAEVMLPVEAVEAPGEWRKLPESFGEGVGMVYTCASTEESRFIFTCVHISPDFVEACDRFQLARYPMKTGVESSILVRAASIKEILGYNMIEVSETGDWIHFRNPDGLVLSLRRFLDEYSNLDPFLALDDTEPIILPGALEEIVDRAEIFSGENSVGNHVVVDLSREWIVISGEGASGKYKERKEVKYEGKQIRFQISPKLLVAITKRSENCRVGAKRLFVDTGKFQYATSTVVPEVAPAKKEEAVGTTA